MSELISYGFLAPPAVLIVLSLAGALIALRWRGFAIALVMLSSAALYLLATPLVASYLLHEVERGIPESAELSSAQAIVVLGAGVHLGDGASVPDTLGPLSLERVVYAVQAYRRLQLPVAVSGGRVFPAQTAEAALMRAALERDFGVPVAWSDDQSRTTYENALYTTRLFSPERIATVVVVTHAWHLPRALWAFERRAARLAVAGAARFCAAATRRRRAAEHRGVARQRSRAAGDDRRPLLPASLLAETQLR